MKIKNIHGREILDSRGNPTVEVDVVLDDGAFGRAAVPSGASTGSHEALELRDGDKKRYGGKGVLKAVSHVNGAIREQLLGGDFKSFIDVDRSLLKLDGTENKSNLGANAILGASLAFTRAAAQSRRLPLYKYVRENVQQVDGFKLPVPLMNIINGGAHADSGLDVQEFMIVPRGFTKFSEALRAGAEIFHCLKSLLKAKGFATSVGDEGGFAPHLKSNKQALEMISEAIQKAGYMLGDQVALALDVAASELFNQGRYRWEGAEVTSGDLTKTYETWSKEFAIVSIEDGLAEDDWDGWKQQSSVLGQHLQLVGDDIFVTNPTRLKRGIDGHIANSILIKVNQIGSLTETLETIKQARAAHYSTVFSHRSGETEDSTIADLAVATDSSQIKTGSLCRSERIAKYNQLLRIEEELGSTATYWGRDAFTKTR